MPRTLDGSWLDHWMFYLQASEAPNSYLRWAGISAIAGATMRRCYTKWIYYTIYPNLYIVLVGPPGKTHKSSTIWHVGESLRQIGVPIASESLSREGMIKQMIDRGDIDRAALTLLPDEMSDLLRVSGERMVETLTSLYNCQDKWEYTIRNRPTDTLKNVFLNMLSGTTPKWMADEFDPSFIEGGFAGRTIFIREDEPRFRKAFPEVTPEMEERYAQLVDDLAWISELRGEFEWTDGAHDWFKEYYEVKLPKEKLDYRLNSYLNRKALMVLKLGMILSLAERDRLVLDEHIFNKALVELNAVEPQMVHAFTSVGRNVYANDSERIYHEIRESRGMLESDIRISNEHALTKQEIDDILENLVLMKKVKREVTREGNLYKVT